MRFSWMLMSRMAPAWSQTACGARWIDLRAPPAAKPPHSREPVMKLRRFDCPLSLGNRRAPEKAADF
jgi:hypothetical protein